ncbi:TRAP transporter substrate-binding protein DctP [Desertibaculum subflavum]|uniref:TRAP transporter substrate-binding protein DctP n=1 Tax=Desertibaculum subflavum TaxID=2268458 RepID=UPI000E67438F
MKIHSLVMGTVGAVALLAGSALAEGVKMRASLDTTAVHIRTKSVGVYLDAIKSRSKGAIETELYHSGQLFRDANVGKALRQGGAEMAVPGTWVLSGFEPSLEYTTLPASYGRSRQDMYKLSDGEVGKELNASLEKKLNVKVLGKWFDLGHSHTFATSKALNGPEDLKGLKIRTSGGGGQMLRVKFFDGLPNFTAWPDVPLALSQGNFDALLTTCESAVSAKLWDSGVKYVLLDHQFFAQYIPMIARGFYDKLKPEQQKLLVDTWAEMIDKFREEAHAAQMKAKDTLAQNGVKVVEPGKADIDTVRKRMLPTQDAVAKELKVDASIVAKTNQTFGLMN